MSEPEKMMGLDEVIAALTAMEQEERVRQQLSVALRRAPEVLRACKHEKTLRAEREATAQHLENTVAQLNVQVPALEKTVQRLQKDAANWKHDLAEKKKIEEQELAQVRAEIDAGKKELVNMNQERERFKARMNQFVG
ncbi:MAG: hypothetical protein IH977_04325 [Nitrospinae bacterium]|nr:hypothetical protein [Nitrospinota bacterium]